MRYYFFIIFITNLFAFIANANGVGSSGGVGAHEKPAQQVCEERIAVASIREINDYTAGIDSLAADATNVRQQALQKCVMFVDSLRNNRRKAIEKGCNEYMEAVRTQCFMPRREHARKEEKLSQELSALKDELAELRAKVQESLTKLTTANSNKDGSIAGMTDLALQYAEFTALYEEKFALYSELQDQHSQLMKDQRTMHSNCDSVVSRYDEICVTQEQVVVEAESANAEKVGTFFKADMEAPVEGADAVIRVTAAEEVMERAGQMSQEVIEHESRASTTYGEVNTTTLTHIETTRVLLENFAAQLGGGGGGDQQQGGQNCTTIDGCDSGGGGGSGDQKAGGETPKQGGTGGGTVANNPPVNQPTDGAYGGGKTNNSGTNNSSETGSGSNAMGKTGSGFSMPSLGNLFGQGQKQGSNSGTGFNNQNATDFNNNRRVAYDNGFNSMGGSDSSFVGNGARNGSGPSMNGKNANDPNGPSVIIGNGGQQAGARNSGAGGLNALQDSGSAYANGSKAYGKTSPSRSGNKQVHSSRNEKAGVGGILGSSSSRGSADLQKRLEQLKKDRKLASADEFDPDKYVPKTEAERRALARASGKLGGHYGKKWPKDIYRHQPGTSVDVFHYMNIQFRRQFSAAQE